MANVLRKTAVTTLPGHSSKNGPRDPGRRIRAGSAAGKYADLLVATPVLACGRGGRRRRAGAVAAFCWSVLGLVLAAAPARAEHPANPARPTNTEGAYPLAEGSLQMELGYLLVGSDTGVLSHSVPLLLRFGAASFVDVRLGAALFQHASEQSGFGDLTLGARFITNDEGKYLPAFGLLVQATAPTATGAFASEHVGLDAGLQVSKRFFNFIQLDVFGGFRADFDAGRGGGDTYAIPAAMALHFDIYGVIDLFGEFSTVSWLRGGAEDFTASGLVGFGWRVAPEVVLDLAAEMGATTFANDITATVGVTWNFADLY